jgi:hypothetical protein
MTSILFKREDLSLRACPITKQEWLKYYLELLGKMLPCPAEEEGILLSPQ